MPALTGNPPLGERTAAIVRARQIGKPMLNPISDSTALDRVQLWPQIYYFLQRRKLRARSKKPTTLLFIDAPGASDRARKTEFIAQHSPTELTFGPGFI